MTNSATPSTIHHNVVPSEVGWQFVPQYYTFVNKQPQRLHLFYTKASTFSHGTEGEDGKPYHGQQEIHNKITSIGFQDCKVFIHSVDAQSSANGGIIIQVIGEMSNHGDAWRKFVQTFFLAEQPNGYFVLNDIFRFLKEETVEADETSESEVEAAPEVAAPAPVPEPVAQPPVQTYEPSREPSPVPPAAPPPAPAAEEPTTVAPEPVAPTPEPTVQTNGIHAAEREPSPAPASPVAEKAPTPAPPQPAPQPTPSVAPSPSPAPVAQPPPAASAAPSPAPPPQQQPAAPAPAAPVSTAPKTWANLAATNSKKWGSAVAQESRGTTEVPATTNSPVPPSGAPTPSTQHGPGAQRGPPHSQQHAPRGEHPNLVAAQSVSTPQCFVKGVIEPISQAALQQQLTARFGGVKELEIVRSKACAFLEFNTLESAKKAIVASLPPAQGGEGGIRIDVGSDAGPLRIFVETRKERGERPVSRPRGGAPINGEGRGGGQFRGRGGPGRGRGGPGPAPGGK